LHIFKFQGPSRTQTKDFSGITIFTWEPTWEEEAHEWANKAQTSTGGTGPRPGRATWSRLTYVALMSFIFIPNWPSWCKKSYVKTPRGVPSRRWWKNMKPRNRGCTCEDWRGKRCRSHPWSLLQPLQHHQHRHHDEEGEVHLWTMSLWQ
jgi:hypothetical protein